MGYAIRMRKWAPLFFAACTGSVTPTTPPEPAVSSHPDVVVITLDTTRADRLGCYGDPLAKTPNIDAFAEDAVLFRQATTPVPLTLPAHTSLFSGWYPSRHGLRDNGGFSVQPNVPLLAEQLKGAGYQTGGFIAAYVLDGAWGIDRGFDTYFDDFHPEDVRRAARFGAVERPARDVIRKALAWWDEAGKRDEPRFLFVHLFDAHTPYEAPVDWTGDPYRGQIFEMDRALRPLLASLPDDALVIIASDHGENLWDGRELEHGTVLTRSTIRVPLLVRPPGGVPGVQRPTPVTLPPRPSSWAPVDGLTTEGLILDVVPDAPVAGRVVETPVNLVDIAPTIYDLTSVAGPSADGRSLAPALRGEPLPEIPVYTESVAPFTHFGWAPQFISRSHDRLLRRDGGDDVFDPVADPWWQTPNGEAAPEALTAQVDALSKNWDLPGGPVDPATAQALAALGYAPAVARPSDTDRPSARKHIDRMHRLHLAQGTMVSKPAEAMATFEA
ncbi:MAG: sulfatase, partial [Myxococcota bacterium]